MMDRMRRNILMARIGPELVSGDGVVEVSGAEVKDSLITSL